MQTSEVIFSNDLLRIAAEEQEFDRTREERERAFAEREYDKGVADALFDWAVKRGYPHSSNLTSAWVRRDVPLLCMVIACRSIPQQDEPPQSPPT